MTTAELTGLELMRQTAATTDLPAYIGTLIGLSIDEVEYGEVTMSLLTRPDMANPLGTLHGGMCATLLDAVMGCAVHTTLEAGVGYGTLELKVNYIRSVPVDGVKLTATAKTVHVGGKTATAEGRIYDPQGRLVAHGTTTCMIHR
ncbi:MAG TPA: PaaI family thioesterase [Mycobacterium sp.]|nr:PaaI family thioesterase [Mycobacterium sp.]